MATGLGPPALRGGLVLYVRDGCHLCAEGLGVLRPLCAAHHVELSVVDVDAEPALMRQYGERVPVLCHEGCELAWGRLEADRVAPLFGEEPARPPRGWARVLQRLRHMFFRES